MTNMYYENETSTNCFPAQMAPGRRPVAYTGQLVPSGSNQKRTLPQMLFDFFQPVLIEVVRKRNLHINVTRSNDQTTWDFSFQEDPFDR